MSRDHDAKGLFVRALEGEQLTEEEQAQLWRESPVIRVSAEAMAELEAELDRPAVVPPGLQALVDRERARRLEGWGD